MSRRWQIYQRSASFQICLHLQMSEWIIWVVWKLKEDVPITKLSEDPNDLEPLSPNHLLQMKGKPVLAPGLFDKSELYSKRRWKQVQYMCDFFWKRWTNEYLPLLQDRQKWNKERRDFVPGDIVVIVDSTAPRGSWLMGRVLEVFPDKNGLVRSVN